MVGRRRFTNDLKGANAVRRARRETVGDKGEPHSEDVVTTELGELSPNASLRDRRRRGSGPLHEGTLEIFRAGAGRVEDINIFHCVAHDEPRRSAKSSPAPRSFHATMAPDAEETFR